MDRLTDEATVPAAALLRVPRVLAEAALIEGEAIRAGAAKDVRSAQVPPAVVIDVALQLARGEYNRPRLVTDRAFRAPVATARRSPECAHVAQGLTRAGLGGRPPHQPRSHATPAPQSASEQQISLSSCGQWLSSSVPFGIRVRQRMAWSKIAVDTLVPRRSARVSTAHVKSACARLAPRRSAEQRLALAKTRPAEVGPVELLPAQILAGEVALAQVPARSRIGAIPQPGERTVLGASLRPSRRAGVWTLRRLCCRRRGRSPGAVPSTVPRPANRPTTTCRREARAPTDRASRSNRVASMPTPLLRSCGG